MQSKGGSIVEAAEQSEKVSAVVDLIQDGLGNGAIALGERLVELELARKAGVGIGPVREALQILNGLGIVTLVPNRGARVASLTSADAADVLTIFVQLIEIVFNEVEAESRWEKVGSLLKKLQERTSKVVSEKNRLGPLLLEVLTRSLQLAHNEYLQYATANLNPALVGRKLLECPLQETHFKAFATHLKSSVKAARARDLSALQAGLQSACLCFVSGESSGNETSTSSEPSTDTASARVIRHIVASIRQNKIVPGQRLVEADIVAETGVGRSPVRQALRTLAGHHVVELIANRGARIRKLSTADMGNILQLLDSVSKLGLRNAKTMHGNAAFRSAVTAKLEISRQASQERNPYKFMYSLVEYHRVLNEFSGNRSLNRIFDVLHTEFFIRELSGLLTIQQWDRYLGRYEKMHGLLLAGDSAAAEQEFAAHVRDLLALLSSGAAQIVY